MLRQADLYLWEIYSPIGKFQDSSFSDGKLLINVFQGARLKVFETDPHKSE